MSRAAARPFVRLLAVLLHALGVLAGPALHLWDPGACGCGHAHAPASKRSTCEHGHCCRHEHATHDSEPEPTPAEAPSAPTHDPDDCRVCQQLAHARIIAPAVTLTLVALDAPLVTRPLPPPAPLLIAGAISCRGPPPLAADV